MEAPEVTTGTDYDTRLPVRPLTFEAGFVTSIETLAGTQQILLNRHQALQLYAGLMQSIDPDLYQYKFRDFTMDPVSGNYK